ncbi:hypothetical protein [Streptomyces griseomycini]|uniref:Uncharacterized protein n=1 Tax=Streptomyces griseomycini TaxID=66895 RepID=A0A7W7PQ45_9ACTN|nr:hypothetical protein [Streptomyces griseomycini]MBB4899196.1 hypothetical protein [Streptomyces griseomycini]GGQ05292.1 hypothetical protein GCM10010266_30700 [Streptomyces griseomycini]GGR20581.1 hypothetical protein GCM10015536_27680 [Streptomyces griseomycini]
MLLERTATRSVLAGLGGGTLDSLSVWADARLNVYEGRLETDRTRHRAQAEKIAGNREAMKHLVEALEPLLADFERAHPGSRLSNRA